MLSKELAARIRLSPLRAYQIAQIAGLHPSTLSKLLNGIARPHPNDQRIVAVGRVLGLRPDECFESDTVPGPAVSGGAEEGAA
jgi:lambda repressor-like predicted transcriptional regulator